MKRPGTFPRVVVALLVIAAFGPYLPGSSFRTEQIVIYGSAVVLLPFVMLTTHVPVWGLRIVVPWVAYVMATTVAIAMPSPVGSKWLPGSLLAGVDNLLLPLGVMFVVWGVARRETVGQLMVFASKCIAVAVAANGLLAIVMTRVDISTLLRPFVSSGTAGSTVAERAATMGRFSGLFNQPAEAGVAYGLGGLAACYAWRYRPLRVYLLLVPIIIGGFLCVSKVFILGAMPLILWQAWRLKRGKLTLLLISGVALLGVVQTGFVQQWSGLAFLTRLFRPYNQDWISLYSAGRFGTGATLTAVTDEVTRINPWFGFGAQGLQVAYDSGFVEALVLGGLVGATLYGLTLIAILLMARTDRDAARRGFLTTVGIFAAGASLGVPALTANRAGSLLWLLVALGALAHQNRVRSHRHTTEALAVR